MPVSVSLTKEVFANLDQGQGSKVRGPFSRINQHGFVRQRENP
jgi:hypothetical protein